MYWMTDNSVICHVVCQDHQKSIRVDVRRTRLVSTPLPYSRNQDLIQRAFLGLLIPQRRNLELGSATFALWLIKLTKWWWPTRQCVRLYTRRRVILDEFVRFESRIEL